VGLTSTRGNVLKLMMAVCADDPLEDGRAGYNGSEELVGNGSCWMVDDDEYSS
jgi:hypothetical protein